ncbi:unnamed protein product [Schistocephalus solidus]|nr:unnamed protein product [Schistocephalus solidus]
MSDRVPPAGLERSHRYFCYVCGTLLPHRLVANDSFVCRKCSTPTYLSWFVGMKVSFDDESGPESDMSRLQSWPFFPKMLERALTILRSEEALKLSTETEGTVTTSRDGPSVKKDCPYCGNDRMTYTTMQTRSADEGQTVIYTCTQCHKKEVENT